MKYVKQFGTYRFIDNQGVVVCKNVALWSSVEHISVYRKILSPEITPPIYKGMIISNIADAKIRTELQSMPRCLAA